MRATVTLLPLLTLLLSAPVGAAPAQDDAVASRLQDAFHRVDELERISVDVEAGVVQLSGRVLDDADRERAVRVAESMDGVLLVDDDIVLENRLRARLEPAIDDLASWGAQTLAWLPVALLGVVALLASLGIGRLLRTFGPLQRSLGTRPILRQMIGRVVSLVSLAVGVVICLEIMGLSSLASTIVGTAGVAGLAAGFALKDVIENYVAGLLLALQQPFAKDDFVEIGDDTGLVVRVSMRNTLLLTLDGNHVYVPNATVFKSVVHNLTRNPLRRFGFEVGVGVEEPLRDVIAVARGVLADMPAVLAEPGPQVLIRELGESNVVLQVFGWVDQTEADFVGVRTEAIRRVKVAFDEAGYDMPEPIYRVSMQRRAARPAEAPRATDPPGPAEAPAAGADEPAAVPLEVNRTVLDQVARERVREEVRDASASSASSASASSTASGDATVAP